MNIMFFPNSYYEYPKYDLLGFLMETTKRHFPWLIGTEKECLPFSVDDCFREDGPSDLKSIVKSIPILRSSAYVT